MTPDQLQQHIETFFGEVGGREIDIYNEFSLQHEFGIWLRGRTDRSETKIQFERPAGCGEVYTASDRR